MQNTSKKIDKQHKKSYLAALSMIKNAKTNIQQKFLENKRKNVHFIEINNLICRELQNAKVQEKMKEQGVPSPRWQPQNQRTRLRSLGEG